ncbi:MAG TPA: hypothetical protein VF515_10050 [Candidatus Binatia bacterium]
MKIRDAKEFEVLLEAVASDALDSQHHRHLYEGLVKATEQHRREFAQTPTFWWLTMRSHADVVLYRLARLYDQRNDSLSLRTWLRLIAENLHLFEERNFRQRLKGNPFVMSLAKHPRRPDATQLSLDEKSVAAADPTVKKLVVLRNLSLAHRDPNSLLASAAPNQAQLSWEDVDELIDRALSVINRYSSLFRASSYSRTIVGHDDYLSLLRIVREWLAQKEAEIEREERSA